MALTRVRVSLNGAWTTLTYNASTGRYEGTLTPAATSIHQPGGYYSLTAEAANSGGSTASISGDILPSLRLVVRETVSPRLTLVSPAPGYVTVKRPAIIMDAVDETGGSGVDPGTFAVTLDGAVQTSGKATAAISGGYRLTWTPPADLGEGAHVVTFSVSDRDGNPAGASAAYTVDTVPPSLGLTAPDNHRVVDEAAVLVGGAVYEATSPPCTARITADGADLGETAVEDGTFSRMVPLAVGVNEITVTARDGAGLASVQIITMIRLVTDRTPADADRVLDLCARGYDAWTAEERAWWAGTRCRRGSYDPQDWNRVTAAMDWINSWLREYGYLVGYEPEPHGPWAEGEAMTGPQGERYLKNVEALRAALPLPEATPETPEIMKDLGIQAANDIEAILVAVDGLRTVLDRSAWWPCGTINCGGVG